MEPAAPGSHALILDLRGREKQNSLRPHHHPPVSPFRISVDLDSRVLPVSRGFKAYHGLRETKGKSRLAGIPIFHCRSHPRASRMCLVSCTVPSSCTRAPPSDGASRTSRIWAHHYHHSTYSQYQKHYTTFDPHHRKSPDQPSSHSLRNLPSRQLVHRQRVHPTCCLGHSARHPSRAASRFRYSETSKSLQLHGQSTFSTEIQEASPP